MSNKQIWFYLFRCSFVCAALFFSGSTLAQNSKFQDYIVLQNADTLYCKINHLTSDYISIQYNKDGKLATMKKPLVEVTSWYSATEIQMKSSELKGINKSSIKPNPKSPGESRGNFLLQLHAGYGVRAATIPQDLHGDTKKHFEQLLRGFCFGGHVAYIGNKGHGFGLHYNQMLIYANSSDYEFSTPNIIIRGKVNERINIHYSGISYEFYKKPEFKNYWNHLSIGLGWAGFREEFVAGQILKIRGDAFSFQAGYSMLFPLNANLKFGFHTIFNLAWTSNFSVYNGLSRVTYSIDTPESMVRTQLGVSMVYSMHAGQ